jgi:DHA1 family bicyclomycin/chloramphenicol resistance-like MFS transporter
MAMLMSLVALTIDAILPALSQLGSALAVEDANHVQWVLSAVFLGMSFGLMIYGPVSDSFGRKNALYLGIGIFLIGDLISWHANDFSWMLIGRIAQGFGAAACRVVSLAMIRDKYEGQKMGQVMSLIMMIFVIVPALAPSVGQGILFFGNWRSIFAFVFIFAIIALIWLSTRQEETLLKQHRRIFSASSVYMGMVETFKVPTTRYYILASGFMFGAFVGYLSTAQQLLQEHYQLGEQFSIYFGTLAITIGLSSFMNSKLVMHFKMQTLCLVSVGIMSIISFLLMTYLMLTTSEPSLVLVMVYLSATFFCFGPLFGNLNTLAVQPLGHIAGIATSIIASCQTLISVAIGGTIGYFYNESVLPLNIGFLACAIGAFLMIVAARSRQRIVEVLDQN